MKCRGVMARIRWHFERRGERESETCSVLQQVELKWIIISYTAAKYVTACVWQPANTHTRHTTGLIILCVDPKPVKAAVRVQHSAGRMNESLGASLELFTCVNKHLDPIGLQEDFLMASHHLPIACRHGQRWTRNTRCGSGIWWIWVCGYSLFAWVCSESWVWSAGEELSLHHF